MGEVGKSKVGEGKVINLEYPALAVIIKKLTASVAAIP